MPFHDQQIRYPSYADNTLQLLLEQDIFKSSGPLPVTPSLSRSLIDSNYYPMYNNGYTLRMNAPPLGTPTVGILIMYVSIQRPAQKSRSFQSLQMILKLMGLSPRHQFRANSRELRNHHHQILPDTSHALHWPYSARSRPFLALPCFAKMFLSKVVGSPRVCCHFHGFTLRTVDVMYPPVVQIERDHYHKPGEVRADNGIPVL